LQALKDALHVPVSAQVLQVLHVPVVWSHVTAPELDEAALDAATLDAATLDAATLDAATLDEAGAPPVLPDVAGAPPLPLVKSVPPPAIELPLADVELAPAPVLSGVVPPVARAQATARPGSKASQARSRRIPYLGSRRRSLSPVFEATA
jgi:hypothetical protein